VINQNTGRGALLIAVSLFFLVQAPGLTIGSLSRPGPGLFPVMVASILLTIGTLIVVRSFFIEKVPFEFRFKNIGLIAGALICFAVITDYVNMLAGIAVMGTIACSASEDFSVKRTVVIVAALCLMAFGMKKFLGVQLPLY
jgi:hypothetical protein